MTSLQDQQPDKPRRKRPIRFIAALLLFWILFSVLCIFLAAVTGMGRDGEESYRQAYDRSQYSFGLSPIPAEHPAPVIQVFAARTWGKRGAVAVHTWIAAKRAGAEAYRTYQVIGWQLRRTGSAVAVGEGIPDRPWYGNPPTLLLDLRGEHVETLIDELEQAVADYPFPDTYTVFPGPNSNTFVAYIGRAVPDLGIDLPSTAIGKDYRPLPQSLGRSPGGLGVQASLLGLLSVTLGLNEGVEMNILGLNMEVDVFDLALEVPGIGRVGKPEVSR